MIEVKGAVTIDKNTFKEIRKYLVTIYSKKKFIYASAVLILVLILSLSVSSTDLMVISATLMIFSLLSRFLGIPYGKEEAFYKRVKKARAGEVKSINYSFIISFNSSDIEMKEVAPNNGYNVIDKISYERARYLIEAKEHYLILPKNKRGWGEFDNNFIVICKTSMDEEEKGALINLLKERCKKVKIVEYKK
jgi:hypothetical protein